MKKMALALILFITLILIIPPKVESGSEVRFFANIEADGTDPNNGYSAEVLEKWPENLDDPPPSFSFEVDAYNTMFLDLRFGEQYTVHKILPGNRYWIDFLYIAIAIKVYEKLWNKETGEYSNWIYLKTFYITNKFFPLREGSFSETGTNAFTLLDETLKLLGNSTWIPYRVKVVVAYRITKYLRLYKASFSSASYVYVKAYTPGSGQVSGDAVLYVESNVDGVGGVPITYRGYYSNTRDTPFTLARKKYGFSEYLVAPDKILLGNGSLAYFVGWRLYRRKARHIWCDYKWVFVAEHELANLAVRINPKGNRRECWRRCPWSCNAYYTPGNISLQEFFSGKVNLRGWGMLLVKAVYSTRKPAQLTVRTNIDDLVDSIVLVNGSLTDTPVLYRRVKPINALLEANKTIFVKGNHQYVSSIFVYSGQHKTLSFSDEIDTFVIGNIKLGNARVEIWVDGELAKTYWRDSSNQVFRLKRGNHEIKLKIVVGRGGLAKLYRVEAYLNQTYVFSRWLVEDEGGGIILEENASSIELAVPLGSSWTATALYNDTKKPRIRGTNIYLPGESIPLNFSKPGIYLINFTAFYPDRNPPPILAEIFLWKWVDGKPIIDIKYVPARITLRVQYPVKITGMIETINWEEYQRLPRVLEYPGYKYVGIAAWEPSREYDVSKVFVSETTYAVYNLTVVNNSTGDIDLYTVVVSAPKVSLISSYNRTHVTIRFRGEYAYLPPEELGLSYNPTLRQRFKYTLEKLSEHSAKGIVWQAFNKNGQALLTLSYKELESLFGWNGTVLVLTAKWGGNDELYANRVQVPVKPFVITLWGIRDSPYWIRFVPQYMPDYRDLPYDVKIDVYISSRWYVDCARKIGTRFYEVTLNEEHNILANPAEVYAIPRDTINEILYYLPHRF